MAIYEFKCKNCEKVHEKQYKILERPQGIVCGDCGEIAMIQPSLGSFHLAGKCWAKDGYASK